uniref:Haloacid dehalogenase-like hydrolase n=1 Tax=Musca domestica TaxID=7370 RepID=A0A1I8N1M9_MUSDO
MGHYTNGVAMKSKNLLNLTTEEKQEFLNSFDIVLSDCDGVLWALSAPIANSGEAINLLKAAGKSFKFVSNNDGIRSDEDYIEKVKKIGAKDIEANDFILPYKALARFMKTKHPGEVCYCTVSEIFSNSLRKTGVEVVNVTPRLDIKPAEFHCSVYINAVDDRVPIMEDLVIVGPGLFTKAITELSNKDMQVFGKPSKFFADYMSEEFQIKDRKRGIFVGENLDADILFAARHGFQSLFVLSGTHNKEDMGLLPVEKQPDYYCNSLGDFVEFFESLKNGDK